MMSNTQAILLAFLPGCVEVLEQHSIQAGNMAWDGMAKGVKYARNALYGSIALVAIASIGIARSNNPMIKYPCAVIVISGAILAILSAKKLYDDTSLIQRLINSGMRP